MVRGNARVGGSVNANRRHHAVRYVEPNTLPLTPPPRQARNARAPKVCVMQRYVLAAAIAAFVTQATPAVAHPVPFSYLDLHLQPGRIELSIVVHMFDLGHDLQIDPADRLLDSAFLATKQDALVALLAPRIHVIADGIAARTGVLVAGRTASRTSVGAYKSHLRDARRARHLQRLTRACFHTTPLIRPL